MVMHMISVSGVGYWNTEGVVRGVVGKWGEVKKLTKVNFTLHGHTFGTDQWEVKLVKNKEIVILPVVFHLGSDRSSEEREKWKVSYRGMPRICYRCLKEGHMGRECMDNPVDIEQLASDAAFEEAPAAPRDNDVISGEKRTFAQIVKDPSYVQIRLARVSQHCYEHVRVVRHFKRDKPELLFLQEVNISTDNVNDIVSKLGYSVECNVDPLHPTLPGTAIVWKNNLKVSEINQLVERRAQSVKWAREVFINVRPLRLWQSEGKVGVLVLIGRSRRDRTEIRKKWAAYRKVNCRVPGQFTFLYKAHLDSMSEPPQGRGHCVSYFSKVPVRLAN
jgi:hypothetical protein